MIIFDLTCVCGCFFEGWFRNHEDFHEQQKKGLLTCPECGNEHVRKILSPVAVHATAKQNTLTKSTSRADTNSREQLVLQTLKVLQTYVEKNFDDVGPKLAEESLKMHYGVQDSRNIRGVVTREEEKILVKEGIELLKIPILTKNSKSI
jgi:hypothetical protein